MKYKDVVLLSPEESDLKLKEDTDYLLRLKLAHAVSPIENPMKIRATRKVIARLKAAQWSVRLRQSLDK